MEIFYHLKKLFFIIIVSPFPHIAKYTNSKMSFCLKRYAFGASFNDSSFSNRIRVKTHSPSPVERFFKFPIKIVYCCLVRPGDI